MRDSDKVSDMKIFSECSFCGPLKTLWRATFGLNSPNFLPLEMHPTFHFNLNDLTPGVVLSPVLFQCIVFVIILCFIEN